MLQGLRDIKKHQVECLCKPKTANESIVLYCEMCEFSTKNVDNLKRHRRDFHESTTKSISPHLKKRKITISDIEEKMEVVDSIESNNLKDDLSKDGEIFWVDARNKEMSENNINDESKMEDDKIMKNEQKQAGGGQTH